MKMYLSSAIDFPAIENEGATEGAGRQRQASVTEKITMTDGEAIAKHIWYKSLNWNGIHYTPISYCFLKIQIDVR